jgi:hypothetical protein
MVVSVKNDDARSDAVVGRAFCLRSRIARAETSPVGPASDRTNPPTGRVDAGLDEVPRTNPARVDHSGCTGEAGDALFHHVHRAQSDAAGSMDGSHCHSA